MTQSINEIISKLSDVEPTPATYSNLSVSDIPALEEIARTAETWISARAVYALARLSATTDDSASRAVKHAAADSRVEVRVAAASAATLLPAEEANSLVSSMLADPELGVRKFAIASAGEIATSSGLRSKLERNQSDPQPTCGVSLPVFRV